MYIAHSRGVYLQVIYYNKKPYSFQFLIDKECASRLDSRQQWREFFSVKTRRLLKIKIVYTKI